jgi:hypothetical protein
LTFLVVAEMEIIGSSSQDTQPFLEPISDISASAGYGERIYGTRNRQQNRQELSQLAEEILEDTVLLMRLSDRVYELMSQDLRNQKERNRNYGGRF